MSVDIPSLSEAKQKALLRYMRGELSIGSAEPPIKPRPSGVLAPLSFAQEQLWRRSKQASTPLYNEAITIRRKEPLEIETLERSIAEIIRRHEIWRTSYDVIDGEIKQVVHPACSAFPLQTVDLRGASEEQRQTVEMQQATENARRPFDLRTGPLLRGLLMQMADEDYKLAITAHLSIVDGISVYQVFPFELNTLYRAYSRGQHSPLPELPIQYGDFSYWQREWVTGDEVDRQLQYWRKQLAGELPILNWPRVTRPSRQTFRGAIRTSTFPLELLNAIRRLCRNEGATLFSVLLAGFAALLHRYTAQEDIILGTFAPAGRKRSEVQRLLGHFLNPVPLRIDLSGDPSLSQLIRHAGLLTSDAISHDDVPLEFLVRELLPMTDESRNSFFTVGLSLQPPGLGTEAGWYVTSMDAESGGAFWDLYVAFIEESTEMAVRIQYNPDLFTSVLIDDLVHDLSASLDAASTHPEQRLSQFVSHL